MVKMLPRGGHFRARMRFLQSRALLVARTRLPGAPLEALIGSSVWAGFAKSHLEGLFFLVFLRKNVCFCAGAERRVHTNPPGASFVHFFYFREFLRLRVCSTNPPEFFLFNENSRIAPDNEKTVRFTNPQLFKFSTLQPRFA